ncbi:MAG: Calx-beta domain-containing protein [Gloeotrichia echinulata DEX184]|nr:type I secretion C-terminal target domain-containing protein [Gloeotrichia echinulata DEX184]
MATRTWKAAIDGFWDIANNWTENQLPLSGDDVVINFINNNITTTYRNSNTILNLFSSEEAFVISGGLLTVNNIQVNNIVTLSGGTLGFNGTTASEVNNFTLSGGTLTGTGDLTIETGGTFNWTGGYQTGAGKTIIQGTATLSGNNKFLGSRTIENQGTTTWTGGDIYLYDSAVWNNTDTGVFDIQSDRYFYHWYGNQPKLNNAGTLKKTAGTGTTYISTQFNNTGTVQVSSGTLNLQSGGTSSGIFKADTGGTLLFSGGNYNFTGGSLTGSGVISISGGTVSVNEATASEVNNFTLSGGNLTGTADLTIETGGTFNWTGGYQTGAGKTIIQGTATLSGNNKFLGSRTIENQGTTTWTGGDIYLYDSAVWNNTDTGVFDIQSDRYFYHWQGNQPKLNNAGTLKKTNSTGTTYISTQFNNTGTVQVSSGTLNLQGGGTSSGIFKADTGGTLLFSGGNYNFTGGSLTGQGTISVTGGNISVNEAIVSEVNNLTLSGGTLGLNGTTASEVNNFTLSGGNLTGTGDLTIKTGGTFNWTGGYQTGAGKTIIEGTATLSGNTKFLGSRTIENQGTTTWTDGYIYLYDSAVWNNTDTGVFDIQSDRYFAYYSGNQSKLNNAGTLKKTNSTGTTYISTQFNNTGTVQVSSGTLNLQSGGTSSGIFNIDSAASLVFSGGNYNITGGSLTTGNLGVTGGNTTITGASVSNLNSLSVSGGNLTVNETINSIQNLSINGGTLGLNGTTASEVNNFTLSGGNLTGTGDLTIKTGGTFNWTGGYQTGAGKTIIEGTATLSGNTKFLGSRTIENQGTTTWTDGYIYLYDSAVWNNTDTGVFDIQSDRYFAYYSGNQSKLNNAGTLKKTNSTGTTYISTQFNNTGTVQVSSGTLNLQSGGTSSGIFKADTGGTLLFSGGNYNFTGGSLTGQGTISVTGGNISVNEAIVSEVNNLTLSGGTLGFNGTTASEVNNFTLSGGNLTGTGDLTIKTGGTFNWTGGYQTGAGKTIIEGTATLSGNTKFLGSRTIENQGTTTWTDGYIYLYDSAVWNNTDTGVFDIQSDRYFAYYSGNQSKLNNAGTLKKTNSTGTTYISTQFNNTGTVQVSSGTLNLQSGGTSSGIFNIDSAASLVFSGGNYNITGGSLTTGNLGVTGGNTTITGASVSNLNSLSVSGGNLTVNETINSIQNLSINGGTLGLNGTTASEVNNFTLSGGNLTGTGDLTIKTGGTFNWTGGYQTGAGKTIIEGTATLSGNTKFLGSRTIENQGTTTWTDGYIYLYDSAVWNNTDTGVFDIQSDRYFAYYSGNQSKLNNAGTLKKTNSTGTTYISTQFNNTGTVQVSSGTLNLQSGGTSSGIFKADTGGTLLFSGGNYNFTGGSLTGQGTISVTGGNISVNEAIVSEVNNLTLSGGTLGFNGTTASEVNNFTLSGGNLTGTGDLTIKTGGTFNWTGGYQTGAGKTIIEGTATLSGNTKFLGSRTIENQGTTTWTDGYIYLYDSAVWNNTDTGVFDIQSDRYFAYYSGNQSKLNNAGTLKKTNSTGTTYISTQFNNTGTVQVSSGTLNLQSGGTSSGIFKADTGGTLLFSGGNYNFTGGSLTGQGTISVTGGNISVNEAIVSEVNNLTLSGGTLGLNGTTASEVNNFTLSGGNLTGTGDLTIKTGGTFNWTGGYQTGAGKTIIEGTATLSGNTKFLGSRTIENQGTTTWTDGYIYLYDSAVWNNTDTGVFDIQSDRSFYHGQGNQSKLNNAGTLKKTAGTGTTYISTQFNNTGTVQVSSGTLNLQNGGTSSGIFKADTGGTLLFSGGNYNFTGGSLTGQGTISVTGGNISVNEAIVSEVNNLTLSGGTLGLNGTTASEVNNFTLSGGNLTGTADLTIETGGTFNWTGGYQTGAGKTIIEGTATLSGSTKYLGSRTIENQGTTTWTGGDIYLYDSAVWNNTDTGVFDIQSDRSFVYYYGNQSKLNNAGILKKTAGTGTTYISTQFNNTGTVQVSSGTLNLQSGGTSSGNWAVNNGAILQFSSNYTLQGGTLAGSGTIIGNVSNLTQINPGDGIGTLKITGNYTQSTSSNLNIELGGATNYDRLNITGNASLNGNLNISLVNGFTPILGDRYTILDFGGNFSGGFTNITGFNLGNGLLLQSLVVNKSLVLDVVQDVNYKPGIFSFNANNFSVNENGTPVSAVTINRTGGTDGIASVTLNPTDGTANAPADYNNAPIVVNFANGEASKTVTIPIVNDTIYEGDETLNLTLSNPTGGATLGTQKTSALTIVDNDLPTISIAVAPTSVVEDGTNNLIYTFNRSGNTSNPLTVNFNVGGSASFNSDYTQNGAASFNGTSGTITFIAGSDTATLTIDPTADNTFESNETVSLILASSSNYTIGTFGAITATITNDDINPAILSFSASQFSVKEDGTPISTVTINRAGNSVGSVGATLQLSNGTATAPTDYNNAPITVNFADGETSKTVNIPIVNDTQFEADETLNLTLSNPQEGAILGTQTTATLTIINDDLPQPGVINLNSSSYTVSENSTVNINLIRSGGSDGEVSVTLTPTDGTATAPSDYNNAPITVTFANGETSKTINFSQESQGLSFNGVNDYVTIPDSDAIDFDTNDNFTLEAWIKADPNQANLSSFDNMIIEKWSGGGSYPFVLRYLNGGNGSSGGLIAVARYDGSNNPAIVSKTKVNDGNFHHIAFVKNGEQLSLYVDGKIEGATTDTTSNTTRNNSALFLGRRGNNSYSFKGGIDDVRIWNKARTQEEIQADSHRELTGSEPGLVGYWNLNSSSGNTVQDLTSNQNNGTVFGAQSVTRIIANSLIIDDAIYEANETINLTLTNPTGGATLGTQSTANLTIIDNDAKPGTLAFSQSTFSVNENGIPVTEVTITRTGGSDGNVSATLQLTNGTATAPSDYNNAPITVNFANGETSKTVTIPIINDSKFELDETVNLTLTNPTGGATLGTQNTAVLTIINDDIAIPGTLAFSNSQFTVNEDGTPIVAVTVTRTGGTDGTVSATINLTDGIATTPSDYNDTPIIVNFADGETSKNVTIPIVNDAIYEPNETVNLTLNNPTGGANLGTQSTAILNIIDNDAVPGVIQFSNATYSINENGTPVTAVTLTRNNGSDGNVSARINLSNGTATAGSDYNNSSITVNFADGETSKTVTIPIVNDTKFEPDETINLILTNPQGGATLGTQTTAQLTIINDDAPQPGTISFNTANYTANENGTANINLIRTGGSDGEISVNLTPTDGTATAVSDYNNSPITVTFAEGETSKTVTIPLTDDSIYEPNETVNLTLNNPTGGANLGTQSTAILNIIDNDAVPGVIQFSNATYSINENGDITAVTLTRNNGSDGNVSARINLSNGTATAPSDYNNTPITVNFANGETSKTVTIPIVNDTQFEPNETINLTLTNPLGGATLGTQTTAQLTIINDDAPQPGTVSFNTANYTVNENGTANINLIRSGGSDGEISVTLTPADGTATAVSDYNNSPITVTFAEGETSKTVTIPLTDDSIYEPNETVNLTLNNPTGGANLGTQSTAILNIIDNDAVPGVIQFSNATYSINENGTPVTAVTLTRNNGSDGNVSARVNLSNGTATAGSDYNNSSITVNFADGETSKTVTIPIIDDSQFEADETINLTLSNPSNGATIGTQNSAIVNIIDNDFKPTLTLSIASDTIQEGASGGPAVTTATITRNTDTTNPLIITLNNSDSSQIQVPTTVTIAPGQTSATFNIGAIDDNLIETNQTYTVIATTTGFISGSDQIIISDNDRPSLTVSLDKSAIAENAGNDVVTGTVTRDIVTNTPLVVKLSSSDTTEVKVPQQVTIAAGEAAATFTIDAVDDNILDGTQTVTISAKPTYTASNSTLETGSGTVSLQVTDNESPTLSLTLDRYVIGESGTATATVTRNTDTSSELTVTLTSSDTTEATVPQTIIIPSGQTSATFTVSGVNDGISDGNKPSTIIASATGFNSGIQSIAVTDIDRPDLVVTTLNGATPTYTGKQSTFNYRVENQGLATATPRYQVGVTPPEKEPWVDRVYISTDNKLDNNDIFVGEYPFSDSVPVDLFYERNISYFTPRNPGQYYLIAVTDATNKLNEGTGIPENNNTTITPFIVTPAYRATVSTDTETAIAGNPIILNGKALSNIDNSPVPYEFVKVKVSNNGIVRQFDAFTDGNGNFTQQFVPFASEGGTYQVNAYFPANAAEDTAPEDEFTVLGMRFEQNDQLLQQVTQKIVEGTTVNGSVKLQNLSDIDLSGLTANVNGAPSNWTVEVTPEKANLAGDEEITVNYSINVPDDLWQYYNFSVDLATTEGVKATLPVRVNVEQILPRLVADTSSLQASMLRGGQTLVEFTVTNQGGIASGELDVLLPQASWLNLASPVKIPSLDVGESAKVSVLLQPSATQDLTVYNGDLVIAGAETSLRLPFNFRAISDAVGNLQINVVDELFFYTEGSPRVENPTITLIDAVTGKVVFSEKDADGIFSRTGLAEGYYTLKISADNHDSYTKSILIGAGETENVQAFLPRQTVKYTWNVVPTEIEDKYTITIQTAFETNVPVPTVVIEPSIIDLANLVAVGQTSQIDMKITNHGLIAAHDINLQIGNHPFYKIEALLNNLDVLGANSSITIPVKITRIADFDTLTPNSSELQIASTPSVPCSISMEIDYSYDCAGEQIERAVPIPIFNVEGNCFDGISGGDGGDYNGSPGGGDGGVKGLVAIGNVINGILSQYKKPDPISGIFPAYIDVQSSSSDCDPCEEKNKQAVACLILNLASKGPLAPVVTAINCWVNIANGIKDFNEGNYLALPKPLEICDPPSIPDCLKKFCFDGLLSGGDDAYTDLFSLVYSNTTTGTVAGLLETLKRYIDYWEIIGQVTLNYYGDSVWLEVPEENQSVLESWHNAFQGYAQGETIADYQISEAEKIQLLGLDIPQPLTADDINKFIARWNRSVEYYSLGILGKEDLNISQNPDFIAINELQALEVKISEFTAVLEQEGYEDLHDATLNIAKQLDEALNGGNTDGVCAKVKIQIDQSAVMTRDAFLGTLVIENGNTSKLENLSVTLNIKDAEGNTVNDLFGITSPILDNITAVDGTGILSGDDPTTSVDEGIGSAKWTFIPTGNAAPEIPTQYNIGGSLSYQENGKQVTVPLIAAPITVYPQAELYLDYFHQRDVFADDPFTDDIVETSVPYSLAVLVRNEGKGTAKNLSIDSAQPKIIDNEKGLLIDFQIIGSQVNNNPVSPSLKVNFGNIEGGKTAVGNWLLKSSLQGKFIEYNATFKHLNDLGKPELSLIKDVKIHELTRKVQITQPTDDGLPDFLVNDTFDANFTPDTLYFSQGGTAPVNAVTNTTADAPATINDLSVQISATVDTGWNYIRLADPSNAQFDIQKVLRADGTQVKLDNVWTTDRTFPGTGRPTYENILHLLDYNPTGGNTTYTVIYTPGGPQITDIIDVTPDPRSTAVNAITVDFSEAVSANTFDLSDITLTIDGGTNLINPGVSIVSQSATRFQITGLSNLTNQDGTYQLTVNAGGIADIGGKLGTGSLSETWIKTPTGNADITPPVITDVVDLLAKTRNQPVSSLNVTFSEKIDLSTFTWQDITLTRNNGANLITNAVTISAINDTTYRINGLSGFTTTDGTYNLTVNGSGIQDLSGNAGTGTQSETWVMDTTAPNIPSNITVTPTLSPTSLQTASANLVILNEFGQIRVNSTALTVTGDLGETGLRVSFIDKTTSQTLGQATVTGTSFSGNIQLPSPGNKDIDVRVQDTAGNITITTLNLFADVIKPAITEFLNVPQNSVTTPVNYIDVRFSEQINLSTFNNSDITLTRNGENITLPDITVEYLSGTTYRINGLGNFTTTPGTYQLKVDGTTIQDNAGNSGDAAKTASFTIAPPKNPGISLTQSGGTTNVTEGGATDSYTLVLDTQPTADVTITLNPGNQITTAQTTLTFTPTNWNTPQTVTVTAIDDTIPEGNHNSTITHTISSTDTNYSNVTLPNIEVSINDNDAEIRGQKWHDIDGDGVKDAGEPGLQNWTIYLDTNSNGQLDNSETSTTTDANGNYQFTNLRPGIYTVAEVQQSGWKQTFPGVNITTTNADIPLYTPSLEIISPGVTQNSGISLISDNQDKLNATNYIVKQDSTAVTQNSGISLISDTEVQLNFNATNYIVKEDGTALTEIWVTRTGNTSNAVSATLTLTDGTAKGCGCAASSVNNDFNNVPFTITFAENETSKLLNVQNALLGNPHTIKIRNDSKIEGDEYFTIKLTNPTGGATIGNQNSATVTIIDDEVPSVTPTLETPSTTLADTKATSLINLDDFNADTRFTNIKGQGYASVIIDTGADLNHPIFGADADNNGIADKIVYQYDFADNDNDASDKNNHGSHITSIVSQVAPDANLIILKVFKDSGSGSFSDLEKALQWVATNSNTYNIASVNLSLGDSQNWTTATSRYGIGDELAAIASQNIIINAASGNSFYQYGSNPGLAYPAIDPNVIAVGAVWADNFGGQKNFAGGAIDYTTTADQIASFSQRDDNLDVFAPGILITGANANGGTTSLGGTSQATAYVTGIATLAQQIAQEKLGRKLTVNEFRNLLESNSVIINDGDNENDNVTNTGKNYPRVDLFKLAEGILNLNGSTPNPNPVNPGDNNNNNETTISDNTVNQVHTVNLTAGEVRTGIDFGNQQIGVTISQSGGTTNVTEGGATDSYTVALTSQPTADVNIALANTQTTTNVNTLTFTAANWNIAQTVTVTAVDDAVIEGNHNGIITHTATSSDANYNSINIGAVNVNITDNDFNVITGNTSNPRDPLTGTAANDRIVGGAGAKTITGGLGNDEFVYTNLRDVGQRIADFTVGEDKIVLTQLLSSIGYQGANPINDGYVQFIQGSTANSTVLQIDRDGPTGSAIFRNFLQLDNVTPTQINNTNNFVF